MDQLIVPAFVSVAKRLRKKTVAEFIADADTVRMLRQIGVDYAQGYHIGRPQPSAELLNPPPG
jgi:EAL domain-containing protein (putative c-di-GMP-specific phosphodiesterase class I)